MSGSVRAATDTSMRVCIAPLAAARNIPGLIVTCQLRVEILRETGCTRVNQR